jgi:hypothetical protein
VATDVLPRKDKYVSSCCDCASAKHDGLFQRVTVAETVTDSSMSFNKSKRLKTMQVEYKNIDAKLVVNEIRNGRTLEAVQKLFGIRLKSEVQDLYLQGLMEMGEIPEVDFNKPGNPSVARSSMSSMPASMPASMPSSMQQKPMVRRREKSSVSPVVVIKTANFRTIGQSGSITLNKALLIEQLGFSVGDSFEIYRENDGIVLKKTATPQ